jgi:PAS domain S-box-containing protein
MNEAIRPEHDASTLRERLVQAEAILAAIAESSRDALIAVDAAGSVTTWNAGTEAIFGHLAAEVQGQRLAPLIVPPELLERFHDLRLRLSEGRRYDDLPIRLRRKDGTAVEVAVTLSPMFDAGGAFSGEVAIVRDLTTENALRDRISQQMAQLTRDITERKRAGSALQQSLERGEQLMHAVVDGSSDAIFVKDRDGRYLLFNESAARFVGREASAVIGHDDSFIFPAEVAKKLMALDRSIMEAGKRQTHEEHLTTLAGENLIFLVTKGPIFDENGEVAGLFGISRDITESRQAEQALRESERILQQAQAMAHVGSWIAHIPEGTFTSSAEGARFLGLSEGTYVAHEFFARVHPDDLAQIRAAWEAALAGEPYTIPGKYHS